MSQSRLLPNVRAGLFLVLENRVGCECAAIADAERSTQWQLFLECVLDNCTCIHAPVPV